ncbi:hypothetical protein PYCC9005_001545 [Savitreella phatthalungensis]
MARPRLFIHRTDHAVVCLHRPADPNALAAHRHIINAFTHIATATHTTHAIYSLTSTPAEHSLIVPTSSLAEILGGDGEGLDGVSVERGWVYLQVECPAEGIDFGVVGLLHDLLTSPTRERVSVFATSTYLTDYVLFKQRDAPRAVAALEADGWTIVESTYPRE